MTGLHHVTDIQHNLTETHLEIPNSHPHIPAQSFTSNNIRFEMKSRTEEKFVKLLNRNRLYNNRNLTVMDSS